MNIQKKLLPVLLSGALLTAALSGCGATSAKEESYPAKDIQASVMWSAGGVCDITARSIGAAAQKELGSNFIFTNRAGSGGAVSTMYVNAKEADGYEVLFGAENPQIAKVMGTAQIDYDDFIPISLYCTTYAAVSVSKDSPYDTLEELMDDVLAAPGEFIMSTTGAGGLPEVVAAMFSDVVGISPTLVPFDGENECLTAVMGGNADYTITTLGSAAGFYESGDIKLLGMVHTETVPGYEEIPSVLESYEGFSRYLPWGPFYGVFVKNGTDQAVVDTLTAAFEQATQDPDYLDLIAAKGCFPLNLSGQEAVDYLKQYRSVTSWLLYESGAAANNPADFGIEKP